VPSSGSSGFDGPEPAPSGTLKRDCPRVAGGTVTFECPRRIRTYAALLAVTLWGVIAVNLAWPGVLGFSGHLKGEDYAHFYVLGRLVHDGHVELLYNTAAQAAYLSIAIPGAPLTYFVPVYGPQVALLFRPFASVPYLASFGLWSVLTVALYLWSCFAIWRRNPALRTFRTDVTLLAIASPALWQLILHGQNSAVALACLTGGWLLVQSGRLVAGGLVLGLLFYKPQLAIATIVVLACTAQWRVIVSMGASVAAQMSAVVVLLGTAPILDYVQMLARLGQLTALVEPKLNQMHSFRAFFALLGTSPRTSTVLAIVCSAVVVAAVVRHWRSKSDPEISFALLLFSTVLISPHTTVYDLVIVVPALMIVASRLVTSDASNQANLTTGLVAAVFLLPLISHYSSFVYVQPTVICLTWLIWIHAGPVALQAAAAAVQRAPAVSS
jgi:alpha-1,2-mannosyltransferase